MIRHLSKKDRKAFERFLGGLDEETCRDYSHFGYRITHPASIVAEVLTDVATRKTSAYIVLEDSKVVGFGHLDRFERKEKRHVVKLGIVVAPDYRSRGIGRKLMVAMIRQARQTGIKKIWLATYADNMTAIHLYRSLGFVTEGVFRKEEFVDTRYRDVISMAIFLDDDGERAPVGKTQTRLRSHARPHGFP